MWNAVPTRNIEYPSESVQGHDTEHVLEQGKFGAFEIGIERVLVYVMACKSVGTCRLMRYTQSDDQMMWDCLILCLCAQGRIERRCALFAYDEVRVESECLYASRPTLPPGCMINVH